MATQDEIDTAIGRAVRAATVLELVTSLVVFGLADVDQVIGRIIVPNSIDQMLDRVNQLADLKLANQGALRTDVREWTKSARAANTQRSQWVHAGYGTIDDRPDDELVRIPNILRRAPTDPIPIDPADMRQVIDDLVAAWAQGIRLLERLASSVPGSHWMTSAP